VKQNFLQNEILTFPHGMTLPRPEAPGPTLTTAKAGYTIWIFCGPFPQ